MTDTLAPGLIGEASAVVDEAALATSLGSGSIRVYGTPALVALLERSAVECVADALPAGSTTVGSKIAVSHLAPTPPGAAVRARAELTVVDGRRLTFQIEAFDSVEKIAEATHERVVVDPERLLSRANAKTGS